MLHVDMYEGVPISCTRAVNAASGLSGCASSWPDGWRLLAG
jgi:hypothetical protein